MRSNKLAFLALIVGCTALWLAWKSYTPIPRHRLRPGNPFFSAPPDADVNESDSLSQVAEQPEFYAAPPVFTADVQPDGSRRFQHAAGW